MKTPQVTYLFGAGASAYKQPDKVGLSVSENIQTLPTIPNLPSSLKEQLRKIEKIFTNNEHLEIHHGQHQDFNGYKSAINWLSREGANHISVDIIARKLFFRKEVENLNKLKSILSTFFSIELRRLKFYDRTSAYFSPDQP